MTSHLTINDLEELTNQPRHVLNHAIRLHGPAPADRIGVIRLWRREDLADVLLALRKTAANSRIRRPEVNESQAAASAAI